MSAESSAELPVRVLAEGYAEETTDTGSSASRVRDTKRRARAWCLTINNFTKEEEEILANDNTQYRVYQIEEGENKVPHIQAFIYYDNPRVWPKKKYPRAHISIAKNINASIEYCQKEDTRIRGPYITGTKPAQGSRSDLAEIGEMVGTKSLEEIANEYPGMWIQYSRGIKDLHNRKLKHRNVKPIVTWIYGSTGVGKTKMVKDKHGDGLYIKDSSQWWDMYEQHEAICIDDFDGGWEFRGLLRLLDQYDFIGQTKGSYVKINSPFIYITSEYPPKHYWNGTQLDQIYRRIDEIIIKEGDPNRPIKIPKITIME